MRHVNSRFLIGKPAMYTMPRSFPRSKKWLAPVSAFVLLLLVCFVGVDTSAQKKRPAAKPKTQQQGAAGANANTQTAQQKPQKKNITPLKSGDTSDGSRITITSDAPLNDYSAYRSGDRYYVVIPEANAPRAQGGLRGRGFEDVQVQKRGNDAILSFKLQPGTNARVSQRFNRLDVELTAPGGKIAAVPTATPKPTTSATPQPTPQTIARPTPQTAAIGNTNQTTTQPTIPGMTNPGLTQPATGGNPAVVYAPTPETSASPGASPEASPIASPPTEQIAQAQEPPTTQPATTSAPAASATTFGAVLRQNWLVILIAALVLLSLVMIVAARSRARSTVVAGTPARRASRKERREARKASARQAEADLAEANIPTEVAAPKYKTATLPKAVPVKSVPAIAAADAAEMVAGETVAEEEKAAPVPVVEETKEIAVASAVDVEDVESEVGRALAGESYNETVIGSSDAGTRALVATGLLAALASRNVEKRERAREAFIKHDYLDEATRQLRTAEAPAERAAAARSLGYVQDKSTTMHLVVALEDAAPEVRRAAVESLAELRDPAAVQPLKSLLKRERDRQVSRSLIKRAIEASAAAAVEGEETTTPTAATPAPETETVTLEAPPVIGEADVASIAEGETQTLEAEAPAIEAGQPTAAALADISPAEAALDTVAIVAPLVTEEAAEEAEAEEAARREAEEAAARQQAEEEERLRVEAEAERRAEEEARLAAEAKAEEERRQAEEEAARLQAEEEERARIAAEEERRRVEEEQARLKAEEEAHARAAEEERLRAEEEARLQAQAEAQRVAEEAARKQAEEEARLKAEEEARQRAIEEERRQAEEAARFKAEEEARLAAEAEALERRKVEEEAARLRAEEEERQRVAAEERRQAEEVAARLKLEQEAARKRAEEKEALRLEEERRAEEERLRLEEEARQRAEAEQKRAEEEAARLRAAEEARRQQEEAENARKEAAQAQRKAEEERARLLAAEEAAAMLNAEAASPIELEATEDTLETLTAEESPVVQPVDFIIERNDEATSGWVEVDMSDAKTVRHAEPIEETPSQAGLLFAEPVVEESKELEPSGLELIEEPPAKPVSKEIDFAVTEKGVAEFDQFSTVPGAILKRLSSESTEERASAVADLARVGSDDSFREISAAFDDPAVEVRNAAARSLFSLNPDRAATFTRALRESPPERRRKIGSALASSGLASEAIGQLMGESREKTYDAFSLLFLMSKAGEVQPLMRAIEEHPNNEVRLAVVKLLALSGQQEILPAFRRLAVRGSLPTEVRSAVMEAIYQISSQSPTPA
jgi:HEAT repeats